MQFHNYVHTSVTGSNFADILFGCEFVGSFFFSFFFGFRNKVESSVLCQERNFQRPKVVDFLELLNFSSSDILVLVFERCYPVFFFCFLCF